MGQAPATAETPPASRRRRGSVAKLATASYLGVTLGVITSPIIARVLGPAARGEYAAIYVFENALVMALALGIPPAIMYRLVNRLTSPEELMGTALRFCAALCLPGAAVAVALATNVLDLPEGPTTYLAVAVLALSPVGVLAMCLQGFLTSAGALGPLAWLRIAPLAANLVAVVALAVAGSLTLVSYLVLTLAISLGSALLAWYFVGVRPKGHAKFRLLLGFGLRSFPGTFARLLNVRVDQIILVPLVAPAQLAFYAIAVTISQLPQGVAEAVGVRAMGSVIGSERKFLVSQAERYLRLSLLISTLACIGIAVVTPFLVPFVYGHAFAGIVAPLLLLLPGAVANAGTRVASPCLTAIDRPGVTSIAEISALAITGLGLWYALPRYGIAGAAAVSSITYFYRCGVQVEVLRRNGVRRLLPRRSDFAELARAIPLSRFRTSKALT